MPEQLSSPPITTPVRRRVSFHPLLASLSSPRRRNFYQNSHHYLSLQIVSVPSDAAAAILAQHRVASRRVHHGDRVGFHQLSISKITSTTRDVRDIGQQRRYPVSPFCASSPSPLSRSNTAVHLTVLPQH